MPDFGSALWNKPASAGGGGAEEGGGSPSDPVTRSLRWDDGNNSNFYKATGSTDTTWTIAMWVKRANLGSLQYLFSWGGDGIGFDANDKISIWNGSSYATSTAVLRDVSAWYHLTVSCNSGTITVYVNGVSQTMSSSPSYPAWGNLYFGRWSGSTSYNFDGYLADIYGIEGSALDHTSFTESNSYGGLKPKAYTGSFGTNGFHIDAQIAHGEDLLVSSIDRNNGDTLFADCAGHTLTKAGDPEHSIKVGNPFTGDDRSMFFDGSDDYIKVSSASSDFAFGTSDYTIEGWFNFRHLTGVQTICDLRPYNSIDSTRAFFGTTGSGLYVYFNGGNTTLAASGSLTIDRWHHIAFVRSSSSLKCYVDGQLKGTISSSTNHNTDGTPHLGSTATHTDLGDSNHEAFLQGYVYDFRIINGTAAYTGEFTPPSGKLTTTGGSYPSTTNVNTSITSSHTKLLIQPEKDDSSIGDETSNHTITTSGALITASSAYESAAKSTAMYFDGNGDTIVAAASSDFAFGTGDFTIEAWYYFESIPSSTDAMLVDLRPTNSTDTDTFAFSTDTTNGVKVYSGGDYALGGSLSTSTWHHIALVRDSGTLYAYIDGTATGSTQSYSNNLTQNSTPRLGTTADGGTSAVFTGYIFDVRITKGTARYTSNFTTPSAPFELNPVYIGADQSGNKNHFAPTNISGHDLMLDVPYPKNYATLNPLATAASSTAAGFSEANLQLTWSSGTTSYFVPSTIGFSTGKFYFEAYINSNYGTGADVGVGVANESADPNSTLSSDANSLMYESNGNKRHNGSSSSYSSNTWGNGDVLGVAVDADTGKVWYSVNGSWEGSPTAGTGEAVTLSGNTFFAAVRAYAYELTVNFGADNTFAGNKTSGQDTSQSEFYYAPPSSDFKSLSSANLTAPITPAENFQIAQWVGNETAGKVISTDISPDLVWIKNRDVAKNHTVGDSVRGANKALFTNNTNTESTSVNNITAFDTDASGGYSFTLGNSEKVNDSGNNHVGWVWKESASAGFDIVTYEGDSEDEGETQSISHSLGVTPEMIIVKARDGRAAGDYYAEDSWYVWHKDLTSGTSIFLNSTSAASSYSFSGAAPISSVGSSTFTVCNSVEDDNYYYDFLNWGDPYFSYSGDNERYIAYLFSSVEGYSKFGAYEGNGSTSGPFIYTGFRPRWIMVKPIDDPYAWYIHDTARSPYNYSDNELVANTSGAEYSVSGAGAGERFDILSNGFKHRTSNVAMNANNKTMIYAAFAESPLKYSNAR